MVAAEEDEEVGIGGKTIVPAEPDRCKTTEWLGLDEEVEEENEDEDDAEETAEADEFLFGE